MDRKGHGHGAAGAEPGHRVDAVHKAQRQVARDLPPGNASRSGSAYVKASCGASQEMKRREFMGLTAGSVAAAAFGPVWFSRAVGAVADAQTGTADLIVVNANVYT